MPRKKAAGATESTALVPVTAAALSPIAGAEQALARMPGEGGTVEREKGVTLVTGRDYATRESVVPATEIYFVAERRPRWTALDWRGGQGRVA
ncbi:hypothetical protein AB5I41_25255 [Sphingomonas sp. MMS24-JH45]